MSEKKSTNQVLLDTKFGTVSADTLTETTSKNGKPMATATMVTAGGKNVTIYAHGDERIAGLKAKVETGEPFVVTGEVLAKGTGISASKFEVTTYTGKIVEITKEGANDGGPWAFAKMKVEGKERTIGILLTDEEVGRAKEAGDTDISIDVIWKASKRPDGRWGSTAMSANRLTREIAAPEVDEMESPGV